MTYYKVPAAYDNIARYRIKYTDRKMIKTYDGVWIKNELYTEKELLKMGLPGALEKFEKVEISRKKAYWFFGARFEMEV